MLDNGYFKFKRSFKFGEISPNSRNLIEAERMLAAKLIITFGLTKKTENQLEIFTLCLKTSAMKETPHAINLVLKKKRVQNML